MDLRRLQYSCKKDPESFKDELLQQKLRYFSYLEVFKLKPNKRHSSFGELIGFCCAVAPSYPSELADYPKSLCSMLDDYATVMHPEFRYQVIHGLIILRGKDVIQPLDILPLFFRLLRIHDKQLRRTVTRFIVGDIKRINVQKRNVKVNARLQGFLFRMVRDPSPLAAKRSLLIMAELYAKNIWHDKKTVNVVAEAAFHKEQVVIEAAVFVLLHMDTAEAVRLASSCKDDDQDDDDAEKDTRLAELQRQYSKEKGKGWISSKKRDKNVKKLASKIKRFESLKEKSDPLTRGDLAATAILLINNPQRYAERLLSLVEKGRSRYKVRTLMLELISRLISAHSLLVPDIYPYLERYLRPKQDQVVTMLKITVQSCHSLVPPELLLPIVKKLQLEFTTDGAATNVIIVGVTSLREMCSRVPLLLTSEPTLVTSITSLKKMKDKGVAMSVRGFINLVREIAPSLLKRKERDRETVERMRSGEQAEREEALGYGVFKPRTRIDGAELLEKLAEQRKAEEQAMASGEFFDDEEEEEEEGEDNEGQKKEGADGEESSDSESSFIRHTDLSALTHEEFEALLLSQDTNALDKQRSRIIEQYNSLKSWKKREKMLERERKILKRIKAGKEWIEAQGGEVEEAIEREKERRRAKDAPKVKSTHSHSSHGEGEKEEHSQGEGEKEDEGEKEEHSDGEYEELEEIDEEELEEMEDEEEEDEEEEEEDEQEE
ncbi:Protein SDA1 homolog, partial [Aduncisulcus paluster]